MDVKVVNIEAQCDLCGTMSYEEEIYKTDNFLYLCSGCLDKLKEVPGTMKDNLENYLIGNVV